MPVPRPYGSVRCPLLDAARANPEVVCPVHLGIARGAVAALGGDPEADEPGGLRRARCLRADAGARFDEEPERDREDVPSMSKQETPESATSGPGGAPPSTTR